MSNTSSDAVLIGTNLAADRSRSIAYYSPGWMKMRILCFNCRKQCPESFQTIDSANQKTEAAYCRDQWQKVKKSNAPPNASAATKYRKAKTPAAHSVTHPTNDQDPGDALVRVNVFGISRRTGAITHRLSVIKA
jgi:hypothetical protein